MIKAAIIYLVLINLCAFAAMAFDKHKAKRDGRRVAEKTLFILAAMGGSAGVLAAMYILRHKTRRLKFTLGIPALLLAQLAAVFLIFLR
ncbi:MAG: DUF1294 domain-containing protein [Oscillospiraceae bacterium]